MDPRWLDAEALDALLGELRARGWRTVGPTVRDGAIVYEELERADELPVGWTEVQAPGRYELRRRDDAARFGYTVGPHAWKRFLFPSRLRLWRAERSPQGAFEVSEGSPDPPAFAFVGVRPCDLRAIAIQDRVFTGGRYPDADYAARRDRAFLVTVDCTEPGGTCFCASMGSGPAADAAGAPFDLRLTERLVGGEPHYLARAGSERGAEVLAALPGREATDAELADAERELADAAGRMGRELDTEGLAEALLAAPEHPRWEQVAARCLDCGNCTLACPTCFCSSVEDTSDLRGGAAERTRSWASCFTLDYAYVHGGSLRTSTRARYRQWLTHKLASWQAQFGTPGCTGCGRCVAWCPAAIDLTEEATAIRTAPHDPPRVKATERGSDRAADPR